MTTRRTPLRARRGFPRPSYEEALAKANARQQARAARSKSEPRRGSPLRTKPPSKDHKEWQQQVRERDDYRCRWFDQGRRCDYTDPYIHAHHINERSQRPDLEFDINNGACLCPRHHDFAHHTVAGRAQATAQKLLGGQTYEFRDR